MSKKKIAIMATACLVIIGAGVLLWNRLASPTRIAFVNYQAI